MTHRRHHRLLARVTALCVALSACVLGSTAVAENAAASQSAPSQWLRLIDVSNWQPSINWNAVSASGIVGAYIEFGDGNWSSPTFKAQSQGAAAAGLSWGAYYFARPNSTDPTASADRFMAAANAGNLPPVLDLEDSTVSGPQASWWAQVFLARCSSVGGRVPTIYTGSYSWSSDPALGAWPLWLAAYPWGYNPVPNVAMLPLPSVPSAWSSWSGWQFTSVGSIPGIDGNVDVSAFEPSWWELYTGAGVSPTGGRPEVVWVQGSQGPPVVQIQQKMTAAGLFHGLWNGYYGPDLTMAVAQWQQRLGITSDGAWGPRTAKATTAFEAWVKAQHPTLNRPIPVIHPGQHGRNVKHLQKAMNAIGIRVHKKRLGLNGVYGPDSQTAVYKLKVACHLRTTGKNFSVKAAKCLDHKLKKVGR